MVITDGDLEALADTNRTPVVVGLKIDIERSIIASGCEPPNKHKKPFLAGVPERVQSLTQSDAN